MGQELQTPRWPPGVGVWLGVGVRLKRARNGGGMASNGRFDGMGRIPGQLKAEFSAFPAQLMGIAKLSHYPAGGQRIN